MSDATKQLTADEVYDRLMEIEFCQTHPEEWRNQVAKDLNVLVGRATYEIETSNDVSDKDLAAAVLRIVERVAEFENIERKKSE